MIVLNLLTAFSPGCTAKPQAAANGVIIFVPGVNGDGPWYDDLKRGLSDGGVTLPIESFSWGAPAPLFMLNFNTVSIHERAERNLADRLTTIQKAHPIAPIFILAHSAGGGVALGAMGRLDPDVLIDRVVLLHPSVSPKYDLSVPLMRVRHTLTHFHSDRDTAFLKWRTSNFGTYDNVKTTAAGNLCFDLSSLAAPMQARVTQIPYHRSYSALSNSGGHFGPTARAFARAIVAPRLRMSVHDQSSSRAP